MCRSQELKHTSSTLSAHFRDSVLLPSWCISCVSLYQGLPADHRSRPSNNDHIRTKRFRLGKKPGFFSTGLCARLVGRRPACTWYREKPVDHRARCVVKVATYIGALLHFFSLSQSAGQECQGVVQKRVRSVKQAIRRVVASA